MAPAMNGDHNLDRSDDGDDRPTVELKKRPDAPSTDELMAAVERVIDDHGTDDPPIDRLCPACLEIYDDRLEAANEAEFEGPVKVCAYGLPGVGIDDVYVHRLDTEPEGSA